MTLAIVKKKHLLFWLLHPKTKGVFLIVLGLKAITYRYAATPHIFVIQLF